MIALPQDLPLVEWQKRRNVPLSEGWLAESIQNSAHKAGLNQWHWTEDVAKAISYYLQSEFNGTLITSDQLQVLIKKSLRSIGYPEIAKSLTIVAPRVSIHLNELASRSCHELIFFAQLEERLNEARSVHVRGIKLEGLRSCVKTLGNTPRWRSSCQDLSDEIVSYVRSHLKKWEKHPMELLIQ
jgi:hypothetical protein